MPTCSAAAFELTASAALTAPSTVGAKRTGTAQLAPTTRLAPQVLPPRLKLATPDPVRPMLFKPMATLPVLASVTVCAAAAEPMVCVPKAMADGVAVKAGAGVAALPDRRSEE